MRALRQCDSGGGGGGGYGSYLCTRHRRDATVSSAFLRTPRRVARGGGANPGIADSFLLSRARNRKTPYSNLCSRILPCGEAFSCYFSSLNSTGMYRTMYTHIRGAASRGRRRRMVAIGVGSPVAQPAKPLASSSASPRRWAEEAGSAFRIRRSR